MGFRVLLVYLFWGASTMSANVNECCPFEWIEKWIIEEGTASIFGVLATVDDESKPYTRTIAIREINESGVLFFTQKGSKKVLQIEGNSSVSLTVYLPLAKRQIIVRGVSIPLSKEENISYWQTYPKESQLRFLVYGPRSGEVISSNCELDNELVELRKDSQNAPIDKPESYVGYRINPEVLELYQLNQDKLSDSYVINRKNGKWERSRVVP